MKNTIRICGDLHGITRDMKKINTTKYPEQKKQTKKDVLLEAGDCGLIWYEKTDRRSKEDKNLQETTAKRNFTFAFVDGNHENHKMLSELPVEEKWGGKVGIVNTKEGPIYHLKRGEIYMINGKKILTIGGAMSQDKIHRIEGKTWWKEELLSKEEENHVLNNLDKHNWKVDIVLSHTCPEEVGKYITKYKNKINNQRNYEEYILRSKDPICKFFSFLIKEGLSVKEWHFGHWHIDIEYEYLDIKFYCHYKNKPYLIKD